MTFQWLWKFSSDGRAVPSVRPLVARDRGFKPRVGCVDVLMKRW
ncbi:MULTISPECIES: hypothetical protein [Mesorhizobium]|nr:hypothetical protein [Mesorhizobium mediterraneum]